MKINDRFGSLVVRALFTGGECGHAYDGRWARVRCDCGSIKRVRARRLTSGGLRNCGTYCRLKNAASGRAAC